MPKGKIYIVEDEAIIAMDLRDRLIAHDWEVAGIAFSAEQALPEIAQCQPDLVLMDIILAGGMDGIEAAARIAEVHDIPTIYITANADPATLQRAKLTEPLSYVIKPIDEKELQINLEMALHRHSIQKKIRESERWLQRLLSSMGEGVIAVDLSDRISFINAVAETLTGYQRDDILGVPLSEVMRWREGSAGEPRPVTAREFLKGAFDAENGIFYLLARNGEVVSVDENVSPLHNSKGEISGMVLTLRAPAQRRSGGEESGETAEHYATLVENAQEGIAIVQDQFCVYANKALCRMTGFRDDEMKGRLISAFFLPEYRDRIEQLTAMRVAGLKTPRLYEARLLSRDGQIIDLEITANVISYQDRPAEMIMLREKARRDPDQTSAAEQGISAPLRGLALISLSGFLTYCDPTFRALWGSANDADLLGLPMPELWQETELGQEMWLALQEKGRWKGELVALDRGQEGRQLRVSARLMRGAGDAPICFLLSCVDRGALDQLQASLAEEHHFGDLIGKSPRMLDIFEQIRILANTDVPLLIQGEPGTGKALLAETIHQTGSRASGPFVALDCSTLLEAALAGELFGPAAPSAESENSRTPGSLERAHSGTLLLENFIAISPALQLRLARFLQSGSFEPGGQKRSVRADVRIIATTPLNSRLEMTAGRLRQDLFFQISGMVIQMPSLQERPEDLLALVDCFLTRIAAKLGLPSVELTAAGLYALRNYSWPGNVEELQNALQNAMLRSRGSAIGVEHLPPTIAAAYSLGLTGTRRVGRARKLTQDAVRLAMQQARDNKAKAAQILGVSRATLYRYLEEEEL